MTATEITPLKRDVVFNQPSSTEIQKADSARGKFSRFCVRPVHATIEAALAITGLCSAGTVLGICGRAFSGAVTDKEFFKGWDAPVLFFCFAVCLCSTFGFVSTLIDDCRRLRNHYAKPGYEAFV